MYFFAYITGRFLKYTHLEEEMQKKDQELIIKGGMNLQISDLIMKSFASG
ncbi:hypothetical protein BACINT_01594 [Bacteroides intestinalis DSM 17393]|uniref:Uncharacterized protein n=1 Tax=Bacteroides intestinalis DSM 17393 TaxID=471870 RepID=B3C7Q3_9BACE|nr:hypothetical protein BACINT_01594 [Bacteroides intestinalis DSM 17393]